jgi:hypothetical protein
MPSVHDLAAAVNGARVARQRERQLDLDSDAVGNGAVEEDAAGRDVARALQREAVRVTHLDRNGDRDAALTPSFEGA